MRLNFFLVKIVLSYTYEIYFIHRTVICFVPRKSIQMNTFMFLSLTMSNLCEMLERPFFALFFQIKIFAKTQ